MPDTANDAEKQLGLDAMNIRVLAFGYFTFALFEQVVADVIARYGLNMGEFTVLWLLHNSKKEINLTQVKEGTMKYSGASITKIADLLLEKGYITRRENPRSRREKLIRATPAGEKTAVQALAEIDKLNGPLMKGLSGTERRDLLKSLKVIFENIISVKCGI